MKRFALAAFFGSMRQAVAIVVGVLALGGAAYLGGHKLDNPGHYPSCLYAPGRHLEPTFHACSPPTRAAWQIPVATVLAALGLATAAALAGEPRRRHATA